MVKMVKTNLVFLTVTLITFLRLAKGTITSPTDGQRFVFLPGFSHNITWRFSGAGSINFRSWSFRIFDSPAAQQIVTIIGNNGNPTYETSVLKSLGLDVEVFKPATLMLKNVTQSFNGVYTFLLLAPVSVSSTVNVFIATKPNVIINCSTLVVVNEGGNVSCVCRGEGGIPPANVTWFNKDNTTVSEFGVESATLVITNVAVHDNGSYRCKAQSFDNPGFRDQKSIEIQVKSKPTVLIDCSTRLVVNESDSVSCVCRGVGGHPTPNVTWFNKDNKIVNGIGEGSKELVLTNVTVNGGGNYTCKAESYNDPRFRDEKSIEIIVQYRPRNTNINLSVTKVKKGQPVTISCESDGLPEPTYTIYHNGAVISNNKIYIIQSVNFNNAGSYSCEAKNKLGNNLSDVKNLTIITVKPTVVINCSTPLVVNEGDNVSCVCRGEGGNPPANVTWFDKDNNIIGDVGVVSKTLVITNVTLNDGGNYTCKAQSFNDPRFRDEKSIEVTVKATFRPQQSNITISPMSVKQGQNVTITCESDGYPEPIYIIYHNGAVISNNKTYIINSVNFNNAGSYRCEAKNKLGNDLSDVKNLTIIKDEPLCMNKTLTNCPDNFDCVDTLGSFACVCRGLMQDGDCIRAGFVRYHIQLTVIEPFDSALCNQNSTAFAEFQTRFNESIKAVYAGDPSFFIVKINELRDGKNDKVIIDANITYRVPDSLNLLFEAVRNNSLPNFNVSNNGLIVVVTGTCASSTCPANSTCQGLTSKTYTCPCEDGFYEDGFNCTELVNVNVQLTIAREFTTSLRNSSSEEFKQLNTSLHQALTRQFQDTRNFQDIKILRFRNGSTIVDFNVRYRRDPSQNVKVVVANTLYEKITKPGSIGNFTVERAEINGTPPPPQGLTVTGVAVTSINVTWQQPDSFNVFGIQHYQTRLNPERGMNEKNITATMGTNNAMFQNLLDNTSYAISVYAVNDDGVGDVAMITVTTNEDVNECNNSATTCPNNLTCVNTLGSFRCICRGVVNSDGNCTRQGAVEFNRIFLTVNENFTPGLANKSSSAFRVFQDKFTTSMATVYNTRQFGFVQAVINELRAGSVIIDADVTFDQVGANGLSVLFTAVRTRMVGAFNVSINALVVVITGTCNDIPCHANSTCFTLSPTTVECRCLPGFYPNGLQCLELVNVTIKIILDGEFTSDLNDNTSAAYIDLAGRLTQELSRRFQDTPNFQDVEILGFRNGSIIVDARIILRQGPQNAKVIVADTIRERLVNGTLLLGFLIQGATVLGPPPPPQNVTITHVGEKSITFTWQHRASFVAFGIKIYEIRSNPPLPGNALRNRTPEVATLSETFVGLESDTFYTINVTAINDDGSAERLITAKTDDDSDDTTLIVLVVVLPIVLIVIIVLLIFFRQHRRQKQVYQTGGRRRPSIEMDDHWRTQYDNAGQDN